MAGIEPASEPIAVPELQAGRPEISMAPLIDVVFLLLIFFMVTTVFPDNRGLVIEKPETRQSDGLRTDSMVFVIAKDGRIAFDGHIVAVHDVERLVREALQAAPSTPVMLHVDRRVTTDVLVKVMDASKHGGARQIGIATDVAR